MATQTNTTTTNVNRRGSLHLGPNGQRAQAIRSLKERYPYLSCQSLRALADHRGPGPVAPLPLGASAQEVAQAIKSLELPCVEAEGVKVSGPRTVSVRGWRKEHLPLLRGLLPQGTRFVPFEYPIPGPRGWEAEMGRGLWVLIP